MSVDHKRVLNQQHNTLRENLELSGLLPELRSRGALTKHDVEKVRAKDTSAEQNSLLLELLSKKPDAAYTELVQALDKTNQPHLAKCLQPTGEMFSLK